MHNFILQFHPSNVDKAIDIIFPRRVRRENACKNNIVCKLWHLYNKMELCCTHQLSRIDIALCNN